MKKTIVYHNIPEKKKEEPKKGPKLSILITAYNTEKFIRKCISSINAQNWGGEMEILVCDDGSTDDTFKNIPSSAIIIKNDKNRGIAYSFNRLAKMATGDYIFFMGSDDYLTGNYFHYAYNEITKNGYELVYTNMRVENDNGEYIGECKLYLPIFHKKYLIKWKNNSHGYGFDVPQIKYLESIKSICNPSVDYHYVRWERNITKIRNKR